MKKYLAIITTGVLAAAFVVSCNNRAAENKRVTLWRNDKIRYGACVAYNWMKHVFPDAQVHPVKTAPGTYEDVEDHPEAWIAMKADPRRKIRMVISPKVLPDTREWNRLLSLLGEGNDVFISTLRITQEMEDSLGVELSPSKPFSPRFEDSLVASVTDPVTGEEHTYAYPGYNGGAYLSTYDSVYATILGTDHLGRPNFVRFDYTGGGRLFLHTSPMAFSNFFLLHKNNHEYYEKAVSWIGKSKTLVEWDDYFRNRVEKNEFSRLQVILREPSLRSAFWVVLLIFALIYLFETKRKQSAIPLPPKIRNSALDFAETVSALYYQRKDNKNLGEKMIHQFAEHLQRKYFLRFAPAEPGFISLLSAKTGMDAGFLENMLYHFKMLRDYPVVSDEMLMETAAELKTFYKKEQYGQRDAGTGI